MHHSCLCPVQALHHVFAATPNANPNGPAFVLRDAPHIPLTIPQFITKLKDSLSQLGIDHRRFAGHSFRRGGATFLQSCNVDMEIIRHIGDWKSTAYTKYLTPSLSTLRQAMAPVGGYTTSTLGIGASHGQRL